MKNYQIGMYEKAVPEEHSVPEMLVLGREAGYDFFEISIDRTEQRIARLYEKGYAAQLLRVAAEGGIPLRSVCVSALGTYTLGNEDPETVRRARDIFLRAVDFAAQTGARMIQIPACDVPKGGPHTPDTDRRFAGNLRELMEYAAANGVPVGLENMEDGYMDSVEKSLRLIDAVHSPYFRLYSDAGNITSAAKLSGTDPVDDLEKGKGRYIAFHLKETKPGRYGGLAYGEGHVDFRRMVSAAWQLGIRRYVMEYWYTGSNAWKNDLKHARELCEGWIERAKNEQHESI